jgi:hypothetical protein
MHSLVFQLATEADDEGLRRLLRENPMPGSISLSFEREPCYFDASLIEGPFHQTLVARESSTGEIVGVGNRSVRLLFLNGKVQSVGYMSQLRIHPKYGKGLYLARGLAEGFKLYYNLHTDGCAPFYLMSVIEDNLPARRLLTSGLPAYPHVREYTRMFTYAIYPVRAKPEVELPRGLRLVRGAEIHTQRIVDFLNRNGARKQFAPYWTPVSLFAANLAPADFFLAMDGERLVGCLACWDQSAFKQTVVRGYSGALARWRILINFLSHFNLAPYLPEPNTRLNHCYASHIALDNDDPIVFAALARAFYNYTVERRYSYFTIGLAEASPLRAVAARYHPIAYKSQLYLVDWEDGSSSIAEVDMSVMPAPEIALL